MGRSTRRAGSALTIAIVLIGFSLGAVVRAEAQGGWSAADAAALKGHALTMDKVRRTGEAMVEFDRLEKARGDAADDEDTEQSIDAMVARINAEPEARAILKKHGLTTREYLLTLLASTHAAAAAMVEESGQQATGIPVSRGQIEFYKANKAELDKLAAERKAAAASDDEEADEGDVEE
jgi:D-alanyl-D-alanine carboxypeptidase